MAHRWKILIIYSLCFCPFGMQGQPDFTAATRATINELISFVALPNDAIHPEDIASNIAWLEGAFKVRGFTTRRLETANLPLLFAEKIKDPVLPTVLFYMHLDGQGVDPGKWDQADPYRVVLKAKTEKGFESIPMSKLEGELDPDWRLFGRSAADDKGPIVAFLHTLDLLKDQAITIPYNVKVILDSEEEKGSKPLPAAVKKYRDILAADLLIINDGPIHLSNRPTIIYGCRGNMGVGLTVFGSIKPQHSGHYGNYVPNPAFRLGRLLASMKDEEGRVLIPGYYDGIELTPEIKAKLSEVPDNEAQIADLMQISQPEKVGNNYQESLQYPSLNVRGMAAAWVGDQVRTIIPSEALAEFDFRLVPESDPEALLKVFVEHIERQGYLVLNRPPSEKQRKMHDKIAMIKVSPPTYPFRTPMDAAEGNWARTALQDHFGKAPIEIRIMGGTVPVAAFIRELDVPTLIIPMVNADNNQHAPNENMRIGNLTNALETFYALLTRNTDF